MHGGAVADEDCVERAEKADEKSEMNFEIVMYEPGVDERLDEDWYVVVDELVVVVVGVVEAAAVEEAIVVVVVVYVIEEAILAPS